MCAARLPDAFVNLSLTKKSIWCDLEGVRIVVQAVVFDEPYGGSFFHDNRLHRGVCMGRRSGMAILGGIQNARILRAGPDRTTVPCGGWDVEDL